MAEMSHVCTNCGRKVSKFHAKCPSCGSTSLKPISLTKWKTCVNCGKKVNESLRKCPYCSTSFESKTGQSKSDSIEKSGRKANENNGMTISQFIKYRLFYRKYSGVFLFSRAKFINVVAFCIIFLYFMPGSIDYLISFIWVVIVFVPVYIITYIAQGIVENDYSIKIRLKNREDSLTDNIVHFLFFWHDAKSNTFTFSKTKTVSILIYAGYVLWKLPTTTSFLADVFVGLFLFVPALLVGSLIHSILEDRKVEKIPKPEKPKIDANKKITRKAEVNANKKITHKPVKFFKYAPEIEKLKLEFDEKEKTVKDLIEKRFKPPQITYTKFIASVDECRVMFDSQVDAIYSIMNLSDAETPRMEAEILEKIDILREIIEKIDLLIDELVLSMGKPKEDVEVLFDDMEQLIDSVKDYD